MSEPHILDSEIINSWYTASDEREPEWCADIESLLKTLAEDHRYRVERLRSELVWLRHEAWKRDYSWGKERPQPWDILKKQIAQKLLGPIQRAAR